MAGGCVRYTNNMRSVIALAVLASGVAFPQGFGGIFTKADPQIEKALRDRIELFYQAQMARNWGKSLQVVHPDSQDMFIGADKMTYRGFRIAAINWEENYTSAKAVIDFDTEFIFPGFGKRDVHVPMTSVWKLTDGQWYWYAPPTGPKDSPFGVLHKDQDPKAATALKPPDIGKMIENQSVSIQALRASVTVDKGEVSLQSHVPSEDSITITNKFEGPVHIKLDADELPCLTVKLEKSVIEAGKTAKVFFSCKPDTPVKKPDGRASITIEEIAKVVPIQVTFAYPPANVVNAKPSKP